ncbi:uncharacterized protein LOC131292972 [Anopheles ziemanni]|uniref:uncharacterized protein LOC131262246 n=1 Tax=Anopheles coustani TaxID=139045 RepID=UPI002659EC67|nr:uncharacterized protein LOC131262246 [Anopheles coustani]XP_058177035.1 uncharacterized protein LOC131292972 [Anopheles ziemanni]
MSVNFAFVSLLFLLPFCCLTVNALGRRNKELVIEKATTCKTNKTDTFLVKFAAPLNFTSKNNVVRFYGNFTVVQQIRAPLELTLIAYRCTSDLQNCQRYNAVHIPRVCSFLTDTNSFWTPFVRSIQPTVKCPIQPALYHFKDSAFDLTFFTSFPLDGYSWQVTMKLYSTAYTPKREVFCFASQATLNKLRKN